MTIKKRLIMEKALELFAEQGFEATSVQQITDRCGMSKGAFYLSFKSKDELIAALIDYFTTQFTSNIDYLVKTTKNDDELLYKFFYTVFESFYKHSDFAKVLIKEQMRSFNKEFIIKMRSYDQMLENTILSMVERLYDEEVSRTKHDLVFCIKGFMKMYSELFIFYNTPLDLDLLAQSLKEKTNLLANHITIPFVSNELVQQFKQQSCKEVTKDQILGVIDQTIDDIEESIEKESLILLKQELLEPTLSRPLVKGLLENIQPHPHCKWAAYLLRGYFEF
ncbi:TetR/AcrR family transcriptional regulator [Sporosarcina oncorhynchi]|uniref:TetR/AcrR family transcriptional regulator n=1 Tax=Sporosarcina oncorhynchi TaxID=3056444 RepID=A0ABZ0L1K5_9BACL|nr:TetR/AcrR family transcriptional regulator [Sporosarcina sp. T2O-4]WOV86482.1 TetR/AcrR family transcriptional regulator [Sporosarcina sp. T2O-4]